MSEENRELFIRALSDAVESKIGKMDEEVNNMEIPPPSRRHKIRMNRIFRERVGGSFLPFPEEDNLYERIRSKLVIKLNSKEFRSHRNKKNAKDKSSSPHSQACIAAQNKKE